MRTTYINLKSYDLEKIKNISAEKNINHKGTVTSILSEKTVDLIMKKIAAAKNLETDPDILWILVTGVLQRGGSNRKIGNAISYTVAEHSLSSHELLRFINEVDKKATARQFARAINKEIAEIANELNIPGDLHARMKLQVPDLTDQEAVWCSNFQTTNPECPERVREWLVQDFLARFNK